MRLHFIILACTVFLCATGRADLANCPVDLYSGSRANIDDSLKITDEFTGTPGSGSVFGKEAAHFDGHERFVQEGANPIFQKIGLLAFDNGGHCTATLVGECHLLTAGHCLSRVDSEDRTIGDKTGPIAFRSSDGKTEAGVTFFQTGGVIGHNYAVNKREDWGFAVLNQPIGRKLGWMAVQSSTEKDIGQSSLNWKADSVRNYIIAGYSSDIEDGKKMSIDPQAQIVRPGIENVVEYRGDMFSGSSGGPVFRLNEKGIPEIYAIQTTVRNEDIQAHRSKDGKYTPAYTSQYSKNDTEHLNSALTSAEFLSKLKTFIATHPCFGAKK
jgi:V8-like Glu-specific endopeptidase